jgi:hypothetical protein
VADVAEEDQIMTAVTADASWGPARTGPGSACDDPGAAGLVARVRGGDKHAWDALVERYAPVIWSMCRQYRLGRADADDVGQSVWLRLVDHLDQIRELTCGDDHPYITRSGRLNALAIACPR